MLQRLQIPTQMTPAGGNGRLLRQRQRLPWPFVLYAESLVPVVLLLQLLLQLLVQYAIESRI